MERKEKYPHHRMACHLFHRGWRDNICQYLFCKSGPNGIFLILKSIKEKTSILTNVKMDKMMVIVHDTSLTLDQNNATGTWCLYLTFYPVSSLWTFSTIGCLICTYILTHTQALFTNIYVCMCVCVCVVDTWSKYTRQFTSWTVWIIRGFERTHTHTRRKKKMNTLRLNFNLSMATLPSEKMQVNHHKAPPNLGSEWEGPT